MIVRYTTSGELDTSFAGGGVAFTAIGSNSQGLAMGLQTSGGTVAAIVVAGYASVTGSTEMTLARYQADIPAEINMTYDYNGNMTTDQSGNTYTYDAWNRMATMTPPTTPVDTYHETYYTYNALGERVSEIDGISGTLPVLVINDGNVQRSMIEHLTVEFPQPVTLGTSAFTLTSENSELSGLSTSAYSNDVNIQWSNPSGDDKTWLINFTTSGTLDSLLLNSSAANGDFTLPNDNYTLTVNHSNTSGEWNGDAASFSN